MNEAKKELTIAISSLDFRDHDDAISRLKKSLALLEGRNK